MYIFSGLLGHIQTRYAFSSIISFHQCWNIFSVLSISLYFMWEEIRSTRVIIFLSLAEIISSRYWHLFSNMSMDFSADAIAFFVSGIILLKKATESDNWVTFSPLSSKDLVMATSRDL